MAYFEGLSAVILRSKPLPCGRECHASTLSWLKGKIRSSRTLDRPILCSPLGLSKCQSNTSLPGLKRFPRPNTPIIFINHAGSAPPFRRTYVKPSEPSMVTFKKPPGGVVLRLKRSPNNQHVSVRLLPGPPLCDQERGRPRGSTNERDCGREEDMEWHFKPRVLPLL